MNTARPSNPKASQRRRAALANATSLLVAFVLASAARADVLWQIGTPDNDNKEFALAPKDYNKFTEDGFFVVGRSDAKRDWPYVHPGPHDGWAAGRQHTFTILFGLKQAPASGRCKLLVDLIDTQLAAPPRLRIDVNGRAFEQTLTAGAGDASVFGDPAKGKEQRFELAFDANLLRAGGNEIGITTLSGSWILYDSLALDAPPGVGLAAVEGTVISSIRSPAALIERDGKASQVLRIAVRHFGDPTPAVVRVDGREAATVSLTKPTETFDVSVAAVNAEKSVNVAVEIAGKLIASEKVALKPVRKLTVYILPHSHTDIGYTESQHAVEEKQIQNLVKGIEYARRTADYPPGAQFKWNVEVLWAADCYLRRLPPGKRAEFFDAVKKGWVSLNGMYLNELTGLCRPEELLRLFSYSTQLAEQTGIPVDSVMISDVPGYTWATVTAMAHAGIKYFSTAPNYFDRIGDILVQWENKPFYWTSPSGKERVLVWIPSKGYALSHIIRQLTPKFVEEYQEQLDKSGYKFDIAYLRWSGHGDNAEPDPAISEFVKDWNTRYAWPRFIISSTSEAFQAFEKRYGKDLPEVRGDWTPYWEDGAGSSSAETALNRATSDRITQAEALFAMFAPKTYPKADFTEAWRNTLLYSEHTWGAWCSVSDPENAMTKEQWTIKQSYALEADRQSHALLAKALGAAPVSQAATVASEPPKPRPAPAMFTSADKAEVDLFNTTSWARTELVILPKELASTGACVVDDAGQPTHSQRLSSGELAFVARDVPPFAARRFTIVSGQPECDRPAKPSGNVLDNGLIRVRVDEKTGAIVELRATGFGENFADTATGHALNDYLYLPGDNLADVQRNGPVKITVKENGPLVASLLVESEAPGCNKLTRELRIVAGFDYVEVINSVDKKRAPANPKPGDWTFAQKGGKESVNFAFPFNVPDGELRLELPFAVIRPEADQMPSACKNWFTVGRWADVSNRDYGVTWVTLDAPLVQVGGLTATLLGSQNDPKIWRKKVEPTRRIYSWVMNNHWGTNYRAYQEGLVQFRFVLRPHRGFDTAEATRFSTGFSQPLLPQRARGGRTSAKPLLEIEPAGVIVTGMKPSDDGKAVIVRLYGAAGKASSATLKWNGAPRSVWISDTSEKPLVKEMGAVAVPAHGVVTLRAEF